MNRRSHDSYGHSDGRRKAKKRFKKTGRRLIALLVVMILCLGTFGSSLTSLAAEENDVSTETTDDADVIEESTSTSITIVSEEDEEETDTEAASEEAAEEDADDADPAESEESDANDADAEEETTAEDTEEEETVEEAVLSLSCRVDGITVTVSGAEEALNGATQISADALSESTIAEYEEALNSSDDAESDVYEILCLFDITLLNDAGKAVEPSDAVTVTWSGDPVEEMIESYLETENDSTAELMTIHFPEEGNATSYELKKIDQSAEDELSYSISSFSVQGLALASSTETADIYISELKISSMVDGTAPFDTGDDDTKDTGATNPTDSPSSYTAGDDSSPSNYLVRSFDYVYYTLAYSTSLSDGESEDTTAEETLCVEFSLPCDPSVAIFDETYLNWVENSETIYTYGYSAEDSDGNTTWTQVGTCTEDEWDGNDPKTTTVDGETITCEVYDQTLTGTYTLSGNGKGTLAVGVYVRAATNGTTLAPTFTVFVEGNDESQEQKITADEVTVSATARYNIQLKKGSNDGYLAWYDLTNGTALDDDNGTGDIYGRLECYGITLQLYNNDEDKGLKGIELPTGDITFELTVSEIITVENGVKGEDVSTNDDYSDYTPYLWDYEASTALSSSKKGELGRSMCVSGASAISGVYSYAPLNSGNAYDRCYDGGSWSVKETDTANVWKVTVSDYSFDLEDFEFPGYNYNADSNNSATYGDYIGCFSSGFFQFVCGFEEDPEETTSLVLKAEVSNLSATSASGTTYPTTGSTYSDGSTLVDMVQTDNSVSSNITTYPSGTISTGNFFYTRASSKQSCTYNGTTVERYVAGSLIGTRTNSYGQDAYGYQGETIAIRSKVNYSGDGYLTAFNLLQKFDDEAFCIPEDTNDEFAWTSTTAAVSLGNSQSVCTEENITVLFAAKPDKTGWTDDDEMDNAQEEDLVYFTSITALNEAGYTCVGVLYEVRNVKLYTSDNTFYIAIPVNVKTTAEIGTVYQTTNELRAWASTDDTEMDFSWTEYSNNDKSCGIGAGMSSSYQSNWLTSDDKSTYVSDGKYYQGTKTVTCGTFSGKQYFYGTQTTTTDDDGNTVTIVDGYPQPTYICYNEYTKAYYENGTYAGSSGGYVKGSSFLIIGGEAGVTIDVAADEDSTEQYSYDLSKGQTSVDYVITPTLKTVSENNQVDSTDQLAYVVVTVTIPDGLILDTNSINTDDYEVSYTYSCGQEEGDDHTHTDDCVITQVTFTSKATYSVGADNIPQITFSCDIDVDNVSHGDSFTVSAEISALLSDEETWLDQRDHTTANGNLSSVTINVIKLSNVSINKTVSKSLLEEGEDIVFTLSYKNASSDTDATGVTLLDLLPYNDSDDADGYFESNFSGSLRLVSVSIDFSSATSTYANYTSSGSSAAVYATTASILQNSNTASSSVFLDLLNTESDVETSSEWSNSSNGSTAYDGSLSNSSVTWSSLNGTSSSDSYVVSYDVSSLSRSEISALIIYLGTVKASESVTVTITLSPLDSSGTLLSKEISGSNDACTTQEPGDLYRNRFYLYESDSTSLVRSNRVSARVVERNVSGYVWEDEDADGIQDSDEGALSGVTVKLYRTEKDESDSTGSTISVAEMSLYAAYDVFGCEVESVTTGDEGTYLFEDLPAGTYYVVFSGFSKSTNALTKVAFDWDDAAASPVDSEEATDATDSDATGYSSDGSLQATYINLTGFVAATQMSTWQYNSVNNDSGVYGTDDFEFLKVSGDSVAKSSGSVSDTQSNLTTLSGATFSLYQLTCSDSSHTNESDHSSLISDSDDCWTLFTWSDDSGNTVSSLRSGSDGKVSFSDLLAGTYRLVETAAPDGYNLATVEWNIVVNGEGITVTTVPTSGSSDLSMTQVTVSDTGIITWILPNYSGTLPKTGGTGRMLFLILGVGLIALAAAGYVMLNRRRRRVI